MATSNNILKKYNFYFGNFFIQQSGSVHCITKLKVVDLEKYVWISRIWSLNFLNDLKWRNNQN
jgi:hypothetical protein